MLAPRRGSAILAMLERFNRCRPCTLPTECSSAAHLRRRTPLRSSRSPMALISLILLLTRLRGGGFSSTRQALVCEPRSGGGCASLHMLHQEALRSLQERRSAVRQQEDILGSRRASKPTLQRQPRRQQGAAEFTNATRLLSCTRMQRACNRSNEKAGGGGGGGVVGSREVGQQ